MATLADGRTLPYDWYTDPAVLRLEQERVFRRHWQYAGRAPQVAEPGQYFTGRAGDVPVVVVRGRDVALVERVQKGLRSGLVEHGRLLGDAERLIAHFQGLLVEALAD